MHCTTSVVGSPYPGDTKFTRTSLNPAATRRAVYLPGRSSSRFSVKLPKWKRDRSSRCFPVGFQDNRPWPRRSGNEVAGGRTREPGGDLFSLAVAARSTCRACSSGPSDESLWVVQVYGDLAMQPYHPFRPAGHSAQRPPSVPSTISVCSARRLSPSSLLPLTGVHLTKGLLFGLLAFVS